MQTYAPALQRIPLFQGITESEIAALLTCVGAAAVTVAKGEFALIAGDAPDYVGIVLHGQLEISRVDADGNRAILSKIGAGDCFAETLACAGIPHSPVNVLATELSRVVKLPYQRILTSCGNACAFHGRLLSNMLGILARKNLTLQQRMEILDKKTIRERLMLYLSRQTEQQGDPFRAPFDRNGLAEYLAVDRSALSREIGRLREEGAIRVERNVFSLRGKAGQ